MFKLKPGVLVALKTSVDGGIRYLRETLAHTEEGRADVLVTKVTRTIEDPQEYERATVCRQRAMDMIRGICIRTDWGLIATDDRWPDVADRIDQARVLVDAFNAGAGTCRVRVAAVPARIARDEQEAIRAIREETEALMHQLLSVARAGDVKEIRATASRAAAAAKLLDDEDAATKAAKDKISAALKAARALARQVVKQVEGGAAKLEEVVSQADLSPIGLARFAFEEAPAVEVEPEETLPAVALQRAGGDVELDPGPGPGAPPDDGLTPEQRAALVAAALAGYEDEEPADEPAEQEGGAA